MIIIELRNDLNYLHIIVKNFGMAQNRIFGRESRDGGVYVCKECLPVQKL